MIKCLANNVQIMNNCEQICNTKDLSDFERNENH